MQVGIIGTGSVGTALARGLSSTGHEVVAGSRAPETTRLDGVTVVGQLDAAEAGEVVVLALPSGVITDVAARLQEALAGKVVIDTANEYPAPTADSPLAIRVAEAAPDARVVKAFNTIGADHLADPVLSGQPATMFLAGDATGAVETVRRLAEDLGFDTVVAGGLEAASHLEHLARFWIDLSREYHRDIAFRLLQDHATTG